MSDFRLPMIVLKSEEYLDELGTGLLITLPVDYVKGLPWTSLS